MFCNKLTCHKDARNVFKWTVTITFYRKLVVPQKEFMSLPTASQHCISLETKCHLAWKTPIKGAVDQFKKHPNLQISTQIWLSSNLRCILINNQSGWCCDKNAVLVAEPQVLTAFFVEESWSSEHKCIGRADIISSEVVTAAVQPSLVAFPCVLGGVGPPLGHPCDPWDPSGGAYL